MSPDTFPDLLDSSTIMQRSDPIISKKEMSNIVQPSSPGLLSLENIFITPSITSRVTGLTIKIDSSCVKKNM